MQLLLQNGFPRPNATVFPRPNTPALIIAFVAAVLTSQIHRFALGQTTPQIDVQTQLRSEKIDDVAEAISSLTSKQLHDPSILQELILLLDDSRIVKRRIPPMGDDTLQERVWSRLTELNSTAVAEIIRSIPDLETLTAQTLALEIIPRIGSENRAAYKLLLLLGDDADPRIRSRVVRALGKLGDQSPSTVRHLGNFLEDPEPNVRWAAVETLSARHEQLAPVLDRLVEMLEDDASVFIAISNHAAIPKKLRGRVAELLVDIGPAAHSALPMLRKLMSRRYEIDVRIWASAAVCSISPSPPDDALYLLGDLLLNDSEDEYGDNDAPRAITKLAGLAEPLMGQLERAKKHRSGYMRQQLAEAFFAVAPDTAVTQVLPLIQDEDEFVSTQAIESLSSRGISDPRVIAMYVSVLERPRSLFDEPAASAIAALAKLGKLAASAVPALEEFANAPETPDKLRERTKFAIELIK